jgi:hypothetical protein
VSGSFYTFFEGWVFRVLLGDGKSVEEVNSSLQNAEKIVEHVKKTLAADEVPVSAPPRAPFNASGLSPREKIQYALGGNS